MLGNQIGQQAGKKKKKKIYAGGYNQTLPSWRLVGGYAWEREMLIIDLSH